MFFIKIWELKGKTSFDINNQDKIKLHWFSLHFFVKSYFKNLVENILNDVKRSPNVLKIAFK